MIRARRLLPLFALALACTEPAGLVDGLCVAVVNIDGVFFGPLSGYPPAASEVSTESYLQITRNTGCLDEGQPSDPLRHSESNFLPAGTTLHTIAGFEPTERLAVWGSVLGEWQVLGPLH
jgi:hypothetical protein